MKISQNRKKKFNQNNLVNKNKLKKKAIGMNNKKMNKIHKILKIQNNK